MKIQKSTDAVAMGQAASAQGAKVLRDVLAKKGRANIIVATGSSPRSVPGIEIDKKHIITSDEAIHLPEVPKSIAIMGSLDFVLGDCDR